MPDSSPIRYAIYTRQSTATIAAGAMPEAARLAVELHPFSWWKVQVAGLPFHSRA